MKNFVKHTLAIAICAVALLSSCIKEQPYELKIAQLEVAVTRADASTSKEQGDGIGNAMFWVFKCSDLDANGAPTAVLDEYAASWRVMHTVNTSTSMTAHMELPLCDTDHQDYILVAVLNTDAFGSMTYGGKTITLDRNTTFTQLQQALFDASSAKFWNEYPVDEEGNRAPWKMPISNWKTFTVSTGNTHPDNCYKLDLPVYRAVAKAQLFVKPKSDNFTVTVTDAKIHSAGMPTQGAILTKNTANGLDNNTIKGAAVKSQQGNADENINSPAVYPAFPYGTSAGTRQLYNAVKDSANYFAEVTASTTTDTWAGSTFIYENAQVLTNTTDYKTVPTGNNGYYMEISYQVSGDITTHTRYVALPAVVRNHDYQVKATVDAGGELTFTVIVNDWVIEEIPMDYKDVATVTDEGYIKWTDLPTIGDGSVWNKRNANDQVENGIIKLASSEGSTATFTFQLETPRPGHWIAELRPSQGKPGSIVFVTTDKDGNKVYSSTLEGVIDGEPNEITITTLEDNLIVNNGIENIAVLYITARGTWADQTEHSYIVDGILGPGMTSIKNYTISQPAQ